MTYLLLTAVYILALGQMVWLKGGLFDKLVCCGLRLLFLSGLAVLCVSPRFEDVIRQERLPSFAVIEDLSASVRPFSEANSSAKHELLSLLGQAGSVTLKTFPRDSQVEIPGSVARNVEPVCQNQTHRAVFVLSDGWEPGGLAPSVQCSVPVYAISNSTREKPEDIGLMPLEIPVTAYIREQAAFRLRAYGSASALAKVEFKVDGVLHEERTLTLTPAGEILEFHFPATRAGKHLLDWSIQSSQAVDGNQLNNRVSSYLNVSGARLQVHVRAQAPSFAMFKMLSALSVRPSLSVTVTYPRLSGIKPESYDVAIIFGDPAAFSIQESKPVLLVLPDKDGLTSIQFQNFKVAEASVDLAGRSIFKPAGPSLTIEIPNLTKASDASARMWQVLKPDPPLIVIGDASVFTQDFVPAATPEQQAMAGQILDLALSRLSDKGPDSLLRLTPARHLWMEGEAQSLHISSDRAKSVEVRRQGEMVWRSNLPTTLNQHLVAGAYELIAFDKGVELGAVPLTVGLPQEEFSGMGTNLAGLQSLANATGLVINRDHDLKVQIPARVLQKEIVMETRQIDLQASPLWLAVLSACLGLEWLYRFQRRMV